MIVDRRDRVKRGNDSKDASRDNDDNSSKSKKLQRKTTYLEGGNSSFTKKEKALLDLTNMEHSTYQKGGASSSSKPILKSKTVKKEKSLLALTSASHATYRVGRAENS